MTLPNVNVLVMDLRLRKLEKVPVSELICIECCAGSAKLSSALKDLGFVVFPIDHSKNRHKPRCKILVIDLLNPFHLELFWELIDNPNTVFVHWAPPCGTSSRARERPIAGMSNPPAPLRSATHLFGIPDLDPVSKARVEAANSIYKVCVQGMVRCFERGILSSFENPKSAWTWKICSILAEQMDCAHIWSKFLDVSFQHCMHGGKRDKWSTWKCTTSFLMHLEATCDGNHEHAAWGIITDNCTGKTSFATAEEAEYPLLLCRKVASAVLTDVLSRGAAEAPKQLQDITPSFDHGFNRIATFQQPRGNRYPQLLSEFQEILPIKSLSPGMPHRLLRLQLGTGGESNPIVGVFRSPSEFMNQAELLMHPADTFLTLPDVLKLALFKVVTLGPLELSKLRLQTILDIKQRAVKLDEQEKLLHSSIPKHLQPILKGKRLLLLKQLLTDSLYPDVSIVDEIIAGVDIVGTTPNSGIFEKKLRPATLNQKELKNNSEIIRKAAKSTGPPLDLEAAKSVWAQSLEESKAGWLVGPLYTEEDVSNYLGAKHWVPTRRFPLHQKSKVRVIDDCKESGINDALKTTEKLNLMDAEALAVLLSHISEVSSKKTVDVSLQCRSSFTGVLHPGWCLDGAEFSWTGRALDLAHAYKQLGCSEKTLWASVVQAYDTDKMTDAYFVSSALMFGATSSVYFFNRVARALWFLMVRYLHVLCINFYDDYPMFEPTRTSSMAKSTTESFLKILGWETAEGHKSLPFQPVFEALGIVIDVSMLSLGSFQFAVKPSRKEDLINTANEILSTGIFSRADCQSMVGKLLFARGQFAGNALRSIIDTLLNFTYRSFGSNINEEVVLALSMLVQLLECSIPKTIAWSDPMRPIVVFTDGASEGDHLDHKSHTVGAVIVDPVNGSRIVLDGTVNPQLVHLWSEHVGEKFICQVEAYPVLCVMDMYPDLFKQRRALFFIDNDATRHAFIKCTSQSRSMQALAFMFYNLSNCCKPWFARVPSESNPADLPSRGKASEAASIFNCTYAGELKLSQDVLNLVVKHTARINKRKSHSNSS